MLCSLLCFCDLWTHKDHASPPLWGTPAIFSHLGCSRWLWLWTWTQGVLWPCRSYIYRSPASGKIYLIHAFGTLLVVVHIQASVLSIVLYCYVIGVNRQNIHLCMVAILFLVVLKWADFGQDFTRRSLQCALVKYHHCQPRNTCILLRVGISHVYFWPIDLSCQKTWGTIIEEGNAFSLGVTLDGIREALHRLIVNEVSVYCIGIKVVFIRQVEIAFLVSSESADWAGVAVAFGLTEGKFAEVASSGVIGSGVRLIPEEVQREACELKMAATTQKPNVKIIRDRKNTSDVVSRGLYDGLELLGVGVDVQVGVTYMRTALLVKSLSFNADFKKGGM